MHCCKRLGSKLKMNSIFIKNEGGNPAGSFKDRGMTVDVSIAMEIGSKVDARASTENTFASLGAYAAVAGSNAFVFIPSGKVALGKLAQAIIHGVKIVQIKGTFDEALRAVMDLTNTHKEIYFLNSINSYRIEGRKNPRLRSLPTTRRG